jgi:hypothetical protein
VFIASVFLYFYQEASGIDAVILHSPRIFKKAGITSSDRKLLCMIAVGLTKTAFIFVATFLLVRNRRRPLLLISVGGMIFSQVILQVSLTIIDHTDHKVTGRRFVHRHGVSIRGILLNRDGSRHMGLYLRDLPIEATCLGCEYRSSSAKGHE